MSYPKLLVVFGATGMQGGSVINSVLNDPSAAKQFRIRGVTRDPSKPKAQALAARGVEMVTGDMDSKDSLKPVVAGAHSVFAVTDFWEKRDKKTETQQGKNMADVALASGVQHFIWSSLDNAAKVSGGKYTLVDHWDGKADVEEYINSINLPTTYFLASAYMSMLSQILIPNPISSNHEFVFALPVSETISVPFFDAARDTGKFVKAILLNREKVLGKRVLGATAYYTPNQVLESFRAVKPAAGKDSHFWRLSEEMYKGFLAQAGFEPRIADELYENMAFMDEFGYYGGASLDESLALLDEKPTNLKEFFATDPAWADLK